MYKFHHGSSQVSNKDRLKQGLLQLAKLLRPFSEIRCIWSYFSKNYVVQGIEIKYLVISDIGMKRKVGRSFSCCMCWNSPACVFQNENLSLSEVKRQFCWIKERILNKTLVSDSIQTRSYQHLVVSTPIAWLSASGSTKIPMQQSMKTHIPPLDLQWQS